MFAFALHFGEPHHNVARISKFIRYRMIRLRSVESYRFANSSVSGTIERMSNDDNRNADRLTTAETRNTCCCKLTAHYVIKVFADAAIPIMIGIITLIIAIRQQNAAQSDRDQDIAQAAELRKQDLELARLQREEDRETARLQRAEDKKIAQLQREVDMAMAYEQRLQEDAVAAKQRNLSETQRIYEFQTTHLNHIHDLILEGDRQRENILLEYQDDLATALLLRKSNLSNHFDDKWFLTLQIKTGAALRRLDPTRRTILMHTLLEAGVFGYDLKSEQALLIDANVSGVDFGYPMNSHPKSDHISYSCLRIESSDITHATFQSTL